MLLPFLGLTDFNTKGEPREAVVALSMLKSGDWILPVNNGMDIPYKPPFFHYCIALVSLLTGSVDEYTSRLPSALALITMSTRQLTPALCTSKEVSRSKAPISAC
jgi:4-amino-4-deoxy-L-arabinose transferase-like glycosyltransferase